MNKTVIIIPSRLNALRLPNKPLALINKKEMILHVYESAKKTNTGEVYVATPDQKIIDVVTNNGGKAVFTSLNHETGTDRIYEVFKTYTLSKLSCTGTYTVPHSLYTHNSFIWQRKCFK